MTNILVVKAESETEAVKQVKTAITKNEEALAVNYDSIKIVTEGISCKETAEIYDEYVKDFGLEDKTIVKDIGDDVVMTKEAVCSFEGNSNA